MPSPLVSVVIPTYNRKDFLIEAVESVLNQSYRNIELIVADDGSTDGTYEELENRGLLGSLRYVRIDHCGRPGRVRNAGIRKSSGKYIALLDSDDTWLPKKLEMQVELMEGMAFHTVPPLCHTRERWIRNGREVSQAGQKHRREGYIFEDALKKCIIGPSTVLFKRELLDDVGYFDEELEIAEDYELWLRVTARYPVAYINLPLVIKRGGHEDQLSEKYGQIEVFRIRALLKVLHSREAASWSDKQRSLAFGELARKCRIYANGCYKRGKIGEGDEYMRLSLRYRNGG